jgi:hypothetical protein
MVLDDPDAPGEQIIYVGLHDRAFAVRPDGSIVWDVPTGLPGTPVGVFGVNYHPGADAIVGLARDGYLYALDRRTGATVLTAPLQLPGTVSPPGPPLAAPPSVQACAQAEEALADIGGRPISEVVDVLLGNGVEVANYFSIAAGTGRLWVAATAPDGEDGTVDGVSQLGALYGIDLVPAGPLGRRPGLHRSSGLSLDARVAPRRLADLCRRQHRQQSPSTRAAATSGRSTSAARSRARSGWRPTTARSTPLPEPRSIR